MAVHIILPLRVMNMALGRVHREVSSFDFHEYLPIGLPHVMCKQLGVMASKAISQ